MHFFTAIQLFLFPSHRLISQPPVTLSSGYAVVGDEMPSGWERACHPNVGMYYINNTASKLLFLSKFFTFLTVYWYGTSSRSIHFCMHLRNESRTRFPRKMEKYTRGNAQGLSKNSAGGSRCKFGVSYLVIDRLIDWLIDSLILCRFDRSIDWLIDWGVICLNALHFWWWYSILFAGKARDLRREGPASSISGRRLRPSKSATGQFWWFEAESWVGRNFSAVIEDSCDNLSRWSVHFLHHLFSTLLVCSNTSNYARYDIDLLRADVAHAKARVARLQRELRQINTEVRQKERGLNSLTQ